MMNHLLRRFAIRLRRDTSGLALLEFAFSMPLVLGIGLYGIETANLALANLRVSQIALNLADNASRVGQMNTLSVEQLREVDIADIFTAAKMQGAAWDLTTRGRITLSSLEADGSGNQVIHWQRCIGTKSGTGYDSSYGQTLIKGGKPVPVGTAGATYDPTAGIDTDTSTNDNAASHPGSPTTPATGAGAGMGDANNLVTAPTNSGVIFVEINYDYKPVVSAAWLTAAATKIHYTASFIIRDRRDLTELYPSSTVTRATCDLHTA